MIDDIVAFLNARLDDDERVARAAAQVAIAYQWADSPEGNVIDPKIADRYAYLATGPGRRSLDDIGVHIAHWDPARVLAEADAKRRIVRAAEERLQDLLDFPDDDTYRLGWAARRWDLKVLALPYAEDPDYRTEWAPS